MRKVLSQDISLPNEPTWKFKNEQSLGMYRSVSLVIIVIGINAVSASVWLLEFSSVNFVLKK